MSGSLALAIMAATKTLESISATARFDAELLAAHCLGMKRSDILLRVRDLDAPPALAGLVERRAKGEPVAYIIGEAEFWSLPLKVTPDTLIPRPDSETLIEAAAKYFAAQDPPHRILDLGTGSGALLAAALSLFPGEAGVGIDSNIGAANVASGNMLALGLAGRAEIMCADWRDDGWTDNLAGPFDLVLCNPPYIAPDDAEVAEDVRRYEPESALFAEEDGLAHYRLLIPQLHNLLSERGVAIFEIGHRQAEPVIQIARNAALATILHNDLAGLPRAVEMKFA